MELVLRCEKNELCIDHQDGCVGFTVLTYDDKQIDFSVDVEQWKQLKTFVDDSIDFYKWDLKNKNTDENE